MFVMKASLFRWYFIEIFGARVVLNDDFDQEMAWPDL